MRKSIDPDLSFGFLVSDIARLLRERFNATAQSLGLTLAQARVLARLAANEGTTQTALAMLLEVQPISLLRQIDHLEAAGLVERRPHPGDRRMQQLYLTDRSQPLLDRIIAHGEDMQLEWMSGLDATRRAALIGDLALIRRNLSQSNALVGDLESTGSARRRSKPRT